MFYKSNPLLKIFFLLSQIIFLFFFHNMVVHISVSILLLFLMLTHSDVVQPIMRTIMRISPLFLSIFLIGYIFGNSLQKDMIILVSIVIMISYTVMLLQTTSAYAFLSNIGKICPRKVFSSVILFLYGITRFLPTIFREYSHTIRMYRYMSCKKVTFYDVLEIFPLMVNKSLSKVHRYSTTSEALLTSHFSPTLHVYDSIIPILILGQVGLLFL